MHGLQACSSQLNCWVCNDDGVHGFSFAAPTLALHMMTMWHTCLTAPMRPYHAQDWDTINIDWFSNKREDNIPLPEYRLNFIWAVR